MGEIVLRYIGGERGKFLNGIPARDVTQAEIDASGMSVEELLSYDAVYERVTAQKAEGGKRKASDKGLVASD